MNKNIGLVILLVITLSFPCQTQPVESSTKPAMPFLINAESSNYRYQNLYINSNYAIFRGNFGGNMYIDLENGDVVPEKKVDYISIDNDPFAQRWLTIKEAYFQTAGGFYMINSDGLDTYAIGTGTKRCHIEVLDYRRGICARYNGSSLNDYFCYTIFLAGSGKELYTFNTDVYNAYPGLYVFGDHLAIKLNSKVTVVDIETGKLELIVDVGGSSSFPRISGNLIQLWNVVLDSRTLEVKFKADASTVLSLSDNVCYTWETDWKGSGNYSINAYDLSTRQTKTYKLSLSHRQYDGYYVPDGRLFGVVNGIAYFYNGMTGKFELVQLSSGLMQCERRFNPNSRGYNACDNGKQIVFSDGGTLFCYDTEKNSLAWEKQFASYWATVEKDNLYSTPVGSDMVKYFDMNNPQKNLIIPIDKLNRPDVQLFSMPRCIIISQKIGNTIQMTRFGFDGSERELPVFMEVNGQIQYHCCLDAGGASYLISNTKDLSRLYKLEEKTWKMVQDFEAAFFDFVSNDRYIVGQSQGKLYVFDTKSGKSKIVDGHPRYDNLVFVGNYSIGYQIQDGYTITDLALTKILNWSIYGHYIGFDEGKFWSLENKKITKLGLDGKTEEIETIIPFSVDKSGPYADAIISVSNGLVMYKGILYSPDGRFCQRLTLDIDSNIWSKDEKILINYKSHGVVRAQLQPCSTYALKNVDGSVVITNTGKVAISGYYHLESTTPEFPIVRFGQKHTFAIQPGKSAELAKLDGSHQQLLAINANGFLDMDKTEVAPKQYKYMTYEGSQLDYDGTAWTLTLWGVQTDK
ncbi:MAG: hypothetical protein HGA95_01235 [Caldiserica bacterium]|nr:hypothetical protein [Caldisericota bacterium]